MGAVYTSTSRRAQSQSAHKNYMSLNVLGPIGILSVFDPHD